ncbi:nucleolin 2-like [Nymphaea colorata]|uniref:nucleolin 2-like n=1 Tax=Nymphaea colorata TaxID=210225 RepID=UPI00129EB5ED|nr:nucleolin 2-like [Nymphaea colorata]
MWIAKITYTGRLIVAGYEVEHRDWAPIYHGEVIQVGFSKFRLVLEERLSPMTEKQKEYHYESSGEDEQNDQSTRSLTWDEVLNKMNAMLARMDHREAIRNKKIASDNRRTELTTESETESDSSSEDEKSSPSPKTPKKIVPKEYELESEEETSSETEDDSSTDSSSDEEIEVPSRECANIGALKPSERARTEISEKGILGAPPSVIPSSSTSITSKDTKGILGPAKTISAIRPLEWVQPRASSGNQRPNHQNESVRRTDTKNSNGIYEGLLPLPEPSKTTEQEKLRETNSTCPNSNEECSSSLTQADSRATPLEELTPEASPKVTPMQSKEEIFTLASPFRWADEPWNQETREQTKIETMGQRATGSKGLLPPPSILMNQPKEGGMDHEFFESPKSARMKLQQGATQELASQNAKVVRAQSSKAARPVTEEYLQLGVLAARPEFSKSGELSVDSGQLLANSGVD